MKYDWKKAEKDIYLPTVKPVLVTVPKCQYFSIHGEGDPNQEQYAENLSVLYALTWGVRMIHKSGFMPEGYFEYVVYPLESVWDVAGEWDDTKPLHKENLVYDAMIRQPSFVDEALLARVKESATKKVSPHLLDKVSLVTMEDGASVQMLHIGPYDDEPASFSQMQQFIDTKGYKRTIHKHREIYLSDPRRVAPEKNRTVLRYFVEPMTPAD